MDIDQAVLDPHGVETWRLAGPELRDLVVDGFRRRSQFDGMLGAGGG